MSKNGKVNWGEIQQKIAIEGNINPNNPYSNMATEERINHLDLLIRKINNRVENKKTNKLGN